MSHFVRLERSRNVRDRGSEEIFVASGRIIATITFKFVRMRKKGHQF